MPSAKDIRINPISSKDANRIIRKLHYSGKVVNNSQLHFGVFLNSKAEGAMSFGPSLDKRKTMGLVKDTGWNDFIELNRMAFSDRLPRNSESRAIGYAMRVIKKSYPNIEWVMSFADATQCGDGAIYRASGFVLTGIKKSENLVRCEGGDVIHKMTLESNPTTPRKELGGRSYYDITNGKYDLKAYMIAVRGEIVPGHQLRYIYFINKAARDRLTVPIIPFSQIAEMGASMYKGEKITRTKGRASEHPSDLGGSTPTRALQRAAA